MTKAQKERLILSILRAYPKQVFCNSSLEDMQASDIAGVKIVSPKHRLTDGRVIVLFNDASERIQRLRKTTFASGTFGFNAWTICRHYRDDNDVIRYCCIPSWLDGNESRSFLSYIRLMFRLFCGIEVSSIEEAELQLVLMGKLITG